VAEQQAAALRPNDVHRTNNLIYCFCEKLRRHTEARTAVSHRATTTKSPHDPRQSFRGPHGGISGLALAAGRRQVRHGSATLADGSSQEFTTQLHVSCTHRHVKANDTLRDLPRWQALRIGKSPLFCNTSRVTYRCPRITCMPMTPTCAVDIHLARQPWLPRA